MLKVFYVLLYRGYELMWQWIWLVGFNNLIIFFREFQPMIYASNDSFLLSDQDTKCFFFLGGNWTLDLLFNNLINECLNCFLLLLWFITSQFVNYM